MDNKSIHIQIDEDEQWILIHEHETVLESLVEHGINVRKACTNGACGICLTKLHSGVIDYGQRVPRGLNQREIQEGYFLPCIASCKTHITISPPPEHKKRA